VNAEHAGNQTNVVPALPDDHLQMIVAQSGTQSTTW
jgi:hypothetical protein